MTNVSRFRLRRDSGNSGTESRDKLGEVGLVEAIRERWGSEVHNIEGRQYEWWKRFKGWILLTRQNQQEMTRVTILTRLVTDADCEIQRRVGLL